MNFPEAFAAVGIALAIALGFCGFFWMMTAVFQTTGPSDYLRCLNGCTDGWGNYNDLECPRMCLPLSEDYTAPFNETLPNLEDYYYFGDDDFDHEYWYNNGTGRTLDDVDPQILNDTINSFKERLAKSYCYFPPDCYNNREEFLTQFPNQTMPSVICYYSVYCSSEKWWEEIYE